MEDTIATQCDDHDCHSHSDQDATTRQLVFLGPAACLVMLLVGVGLEQLSPVNEVNTASWPAGRSLALMAFLVAFVAGGMHISSHAIEDLRGGRLTIDFLMILAAAGAAAIGDWAEGGILLFLFSLSHALEHSILGRTRRAIRDLMQLTPEDAVIVRAGHESCVPISHLTVGDIVLVRPSNRIPADGTITQGRTSVDQSPMTGESVPVDKQPGDPVFAGTLNQQGSIQIEVTRVASETTLARMVKLVEQAQSERAASQQFTDWFGQWYTWVVLGVVVTTLLIGIYGFRESFATSFYRAMTILVVASPCAVVISIPAAILTAIASAAQGGVLFKGGSHLERAAGIRTMAFDKTGTLTLGRPHVVDIVAGRGYSEEEVLSAAAALECHSEHPLARAVVDAVTTREIPFRSAEAIQSVVGRGIEGILVGQRLRAGKWDWLVSDTVEIDDELARAAMEFRTAGKTVICVGNEHTVWGLLTVVDVVRPSAALALRELRDLGISPLVMLSGDHAVVVQQISGELEIDGQGDLLPEDKLKVIQALREKHGLVGMIGDGTNDAPSLAAADVGFSLGGAGTDVALETADVILLADDLRRLPYAIALARKTQQIIRQNLTVAFGMMGLLILITTIHTLPLPLAVFAHEGSTVAVILNGLRLLAFPRPIMNLEGSVKAGD